MKKLVLVAFFVVSIITLSAQTQRMVLYEAFSNVGCAPCATQNPTNNTLIQNNPTKVAAIKYQTSGPGADVFNIQASQYISPRVSYYNITAVPSTRLDGSNTTFNQTNINNRYAVPSPFFLEVNHAFNNACDSVTVTCVIKAAQDFTGSSMVLHVGMIERHISFATAPGSNGETNFYNIMRRMLPNSNGTTLKNSWTDGEIDTLIFVSPVPSFIYDLNQLSFVSFIQSNTDKAVHQAAQNMPIPLDIYLKISSHNIPVIPICLKQHDFQIKVKNQGSVDITAFDVEYGVNGETPMIEAWTGTLAPGAEITINLPTLNFSSNIPVMYIKVINPNGATQYPGLHSHVSQSVKVISNFVDIPLEEKFTATAFPPADWVSVTYDQAAFWQRANAGGFGLTPGGSAMLNFYSSPTGQIDYLYVKGLDFTGMTSVDMTFSVAYARYSATYSDRLRVQVSTNCGGTWATVYDKAGTVLATAPDNGSSQFTPNAQQWREEVVSLNTFAGQDEVIVRFFGLSGYGNNLYIDDVKFGPPAAGINTENVIDNIVVYPNPVNDLLYIELLNEVPGDIVVSVYDNIGKIISNNEIDKTKLIDQKLSFNTSKWAPGLYNVVIYTKQGVTTQKVVKQ